MRIAAPTTVLVVLWSATAGVAQPGPAQNGTATIAAGSFVPLYDGSAAPRPTRVPGFLLDRLPVTNEDFLAFVLAEPRWQRAQVPRIFADTQYLERWEGDLELGNRVLPSAPVTFVSWFAARAYCEWRGKRLPSESEWEYVGRADETRLDARRDPAFVRRILDWYSAPTPERLRPVGTMPPNRWGVYDMHGLIWEWVSDFNSAIVSSDNRERGEGAFDRYCGGASIGASNQSDYAAFMRYAFRGSLRASYAVRNLGFRCAMDGRSAP